MNALEITCLDKADGPLTAEQLRDRRGLAVLTIAGYRRKKWDTLSDEAKGRLRSLGDEILAKYPLDLST